MGRYTIPSLLLLVLALVSVNHATLPSQVYWNTVLPNTPIPKAISDLLRVDVADQKTSTSVNVGHGGVGVYVGHGHGKGSGVSVGVGGGYYGHYHHYHHYGGSFIYRYAASDDQLRDDPNVALFFREESLRSGTKMNLHFTKTTPGAPFIPRSASETLPFSSAKLPEILTRFSVDPKSEQAAEMKTTLRECEEPTVRGEDKFCATSLESMVDFATSELGTNRVIAVSTNTVDATDEVESPMQAYTITSTVQELVGPKMVACHAQLYAYAVFYCHATETSKAYVVQLKGDEDRIVVKAVAICHTDTSSWNPKHLAFRVLNIKPGTAPVCHFLPQDHVVWTKTN
ncbi:BURP domain-containing protein 3 [Acorus calamus]|uniref:BURP domain-containing protein 3 n=1 Tax=Acorus calamus TaxID=4465 RepID=A0AAV9C909_ACOCL|nr:BURP domain-containing protein 3 [Acorus calamus]